MLFDCLGTLNILTRVGVELSERPVWTMSGDQGNLWRAASVTVDANQDFQVIPKIFEVVKFKSFV